MSYAKMLTIMWTLALLLAASFALAEVPQTINYQGRLTDDTGTPVDGQLLIKFTIYGSAGGGDALWSSGFQTVQVDGGLFVYQLGANIQLPDDLFEADTTRYLGITVGVDPEIAPRVRMITTPYSYQALRSDLADYATSAINANNADNLGSQLPSYYLDWVNLTNVPAGFADGIDDDSGGDITSVTAVSGLSGGGTTGDVTLSVATDGITASHIATNAIGSDEIAAGAVGTSEIATNGVDAAEIAAGAVGASEIATGAVNSAEIADLTILNVDISDAAAIETSKIEGTAVNLSSTQTITGPKTFDGTVYFGDSTMRVSNSGIRIGDISSPTLNYLVHVARNYNTSSTRYGQYFNLDNSSTGYLYGIRGFVDHTTMGSGGNVHGSYWYVRSDGAARYAFYGLAQATDVTIITGNSYGIRAGAYDGETAYGVYGYAGSALINWAGYFSGNVRVTGTFDNSKSGIIMDHPLDPENQYLYHSSVNSPEMMNVYNGNVTTDESGDATVTLPDYFEALNQNYRYQLTCIGGYAPIYIAEKISGNRFAIAGGTPFLEVSWQVTGIRADAFAKANPVQVEMEKLDNEKALYLAPEAFGLGNEKYINYEQDRRPERDTGEESEE